MPLTDTRIKAAKPTDKVYKIYDAEGLYIEVPPTGSKRWRFKYRINGKEKRISLGIYPEIGLKDAREKRDEARRQVAAGRDPSVIKKQDCICGENLSAHSRRMGCASSGNMGSASYGNGRAKAEKLHLSGTWQCPFEGHYPD